MFWLIPTVAAVAGLAFSIGLCWLEARKASKRLAVLRPDGELPAREGRAVAIDDERVVAPLSGRAALAYHLEVTTYERFQTGNGVEHVTTRIFQESDGAFLLEGDVHGGATVILSGAELFEDVRRERGPFTVFASSTSMFSPAGGLPPGVAELIDSRGLPMPTKDKMFKSGVQLIINERLVLEGETAWVAGASADEGGAHRRYDGVELSPLLFGLGSLDAARRSLGPKLVANAILGVLIGAFCGAMTGATLASFGKL